MTSKYKQSFRFIQRIIQLYSTLPRYNYFINFLSWNIVNVKCSLCIKNKISLSIIFILISEQCLFYDDKKKNIRIRKNVSNKISIIPFYQKIILQCVRFNEQSFILYNIPWSIIIRATKYNRSKFYYHSRNFTLCSSL